MKIKSAKQWLLFQDYSTQLGTKGDFWKWTTCNVKFKKKMFQIKWYILDVVPEVRIFHYIAFGNVLCVKTLIWEHCSSYGSSHLSTMTYLLSISDSMLKQMYQCYRISPKTLKQLIKMLRALIIWNIFISIFDRLQMK